MHKGATVNSRGFKCNEENSRFLKFKFWLWHELVVELWAHALCASILYLSKKKFS